MPSSIRNSVPIKWSPKGLTDSADGTNSFPGAMRRLVNLIPDPSTAGTYVCRPAAVRKTNFTGANAPTGPGVVSAMLTVGDLEYGMVASTLNAGKDEPYCYDLANDAFLPVAGITNANTPTTQSSSGDWVPPIIAQVAPRVLVCHPGFPGGLVKFGWFDVSGFSEVALGNTHTSTLIDGNPSVLGVQPGMTITGAGIPANTSVDATTEFVLTTTGFLTLNTLAGLANGTGVAVGQVVSSIALPVGTVVQTLGSTNFISAADTHSNTLLDGMDPSLGVPVSGDLISGAGIPALASVVDAAEQHFSAIGELNATTTVTVGPATVIEPDKFDDFAAGQFVSGFGIPANTKINTVTPFSLTTSGDVSAGLFTIINLASTTGVKKGQVAQGVGIAGGAFVVSVDSPTQVTLSEAADKTIVATQATFVGATLLLNNAATVTASFVNLTFGALQVLMDVAATATASAVPITLTTGTVTLSQFSLLVPQRVPVTFTGGTITLSQAATATANNVNLTIAGGTRTAPLWGAGDCDRNPLPSTPLAAAQMNGRAWFADGFDGIPFSDAGMPCRRSNQPNVQALTTNDGDSVTMIAPLELAAPITGGIVQALIAFEGDAQMQQISGDPVTGNLSMNLLPIATGTLAPLSVIPCSLGTAFVSPQGLRVVQRDGSVTDPIGNDGQGITDPFQFAVTPSRMCAEANVAVLRITVQNGRFNPAPYEEYWFDLSRKTWSGPHSFPARLIQHWRNTFIMAPLAENASLWRSDAYQARTSVFVENGHQMSWMSRTVLLPDNAQISMNAMVEGNLTLAAAAGGIFGVVSFDELDRSLGTVILTNGTGTALRERTLSWPWPIIFKQMSIRVTGKSDADLRLGNLYMRCEILGLNNDEDDLGDEGLFLGDNTGKIILTDDPQTILLTPT